MTDIDPAEYEREIRALAEYPSDGAWKPDVVPFLLRLLDAERANDDFLLDPEDDDECLST
jgi:hypothetical protein